MANSAGRLAGVALGLSAVLALTGQTAATASPRPAAASVTCNSGPLQVNFSEFPGSPPNVFWSLGVFCSAPAQISLSSRLTTGFGTLAFGTNPSAFTQLLFTTSPGNKSVSVPKGIPVEVLATATIANRTGGVVTIASPAGGNCTRNNSVQVTCNYVSGFFRP
ncbi:MULTISPECIES: hypothetical protein [Amycolatopsis]|uniref:Uncharacterized protein n=1 Tax=Amycolatopsis dendrobii TaxID=2760662 RepID=A0A7W3Z9W2_9PSEU|nr:MULTISPECIES: hypothetical protein [Amycolatopsis]MBB1153058.1 hypothetical protein [Amycolatopsis dendrobii]UKD51781.1 hypothetical protein L3Q65_28080 [Amycolatopsis sp. FU40]